MAQTMAAHQKIWCRHPAERKNAGQKSSSQRSVCRSPTSLKPIIAEDAEFAFLQLSLPPMSFSGATLGYMYEARPALRSLIFSSGSWSCKNGLSRTSDLG